ncbi:MAG TPA: DUF917 domain-containing protein [Terriglobales bacterium]|nr:DUF917 domain-containing protein [Terriglobales bacterium]
MKRLDSEALEEIALGATVLGTGGGGDPTLGKLMAQQAVARHGTIELVPLDAVLDDDWIIPTAMMGAPTVMVEKIPGGGEVVDAFRMLEQRLGCRAFATLSIEAGGINSMIPMVVAATLGMPIVDADGMCRAFPEIQMVTPTLYGVSATPMALADEKGNRTLLETPDNFWTERISRAVTVQMGGSASIALYAMKGATAKKALIPGSLSLERSIGQTLLACRRQKRDPIDSLLSLLHGRRLAVGKVTDVRRRTERGFARGEVEIAGTQRDAGAQCRIFFQNENLVFWKNGQPQATVPDLITVVDEQTGLPITTELLKYGLRVTVIAIPCHEKWRSPQALELVGPRYFGYDIDYVPLEPAAVN